MSNILLIECHLAKSYIFKMQTIEGFMNNENRYIDTSVAEHFIKEASKRLKVCLEFYMIEPKTHLDSYSKANIIKYFMKNFILINFILS